jgi:2'-5' RNA ligase
LSGCIFFTTPIRNHAASAEVDFILPVRLFVAIEIPADIRERFANFLSELRAIAPKAKWVRPENLHVTLKFLGHTEPSKLAAIKDALANVRSPQAVALDFRGLGFFPNEKRPRVFWAGMQSSSNLATLASGADRAVHELGFPLEERAFKPHLTLARFDPPKLPANLLEFARVHAGRNFGSFAAQEFHLIESKLKPTGAEYTKLHSFLFSTEA